MVLIKRLNLLFILLLVASSGLQSQEYNPPTLKQVVLNYDSILYAGETLSNPIGLVVRNSDNNLFFELKQADNLLYDSETLYYAFFLEGYDHAWSGWTKYPVKEYTNLGAGKYSLIVRTGVAGSIMGEETVFSLVISRPFYLSSIFIGVYILLALMAFFVIYRLLIHRHIREAALLERIIASRTEELTAEKEKTELLLANVLPKGAASELMEKGKVEKQKFNFATVLFSDIQGFTKIAEEVNPELLIDELDKFFFQFDTVVGKYNIEKIKTIGDAYMCAGGIPKRNRSNPVEVILAAIEMQQYMLDMKEEQSKKGLIFWDIRVGIHTGTVIAGVVGHKKLSYDIWGDTVNIASRMESSGEPGRINISGVTYDYVRDFFICEYRGKMPVKYKGELDMYFVNGIRPELRENGKNEPNEQFKNKMLLTRLADLEDEVSEIYQEKLNDNLKFHDERYLRNIFTQAELIGRAERLNDAEMIMLKLASAFVVTGFVESYSDPVPGSIDLLNRIAPEFGFSDIHTENSATIISDAMGEESKTRLGQIINDSILDYYGRVDLLPRLALLYEETNIYNSTDRKIWYTKKLGEINNHKFYTTTAQLLRSNSKESQVQLLESFLSTL